LTAIDPTQLEALLHMSESDVLDFKEAQYPFSGATEEQKGELVKDVVAFANAWKTGDAHIVIGVRCRPGERGEVLGVATHIDDANLQQLVNSKTNVPVAFEYIATSVDGKSVAVVRIRAGQQRPIFLKKAFGRLDPNTVYLRRSSSTAIAAPDEIARMGASAVAVAQEPQLEVQFADPRSRTEFGCGLSLMSTILVRRSGGTTSERGRRPVHDPTGIFAFAETHKLALDNGLSSKRAAYRRTMALITRLGFVVKNVGRVLVEDLRIQVEVEKLDGLVLLDEEPREPKHGLELPALGAIARPRRTDVRDIGTYFELSAHVGKVQPNAVVWSLPFWIGSSRPCDLSLKARIFGDNLAALFEIPLAIKIECGRKMSADGADDPDEP
jgi:hypothetical protein